MERQKYDVAVSYASEQRPYVERFVARLQSQKMRVYYDRNAQAKMVGKILDQELHRIYLQESNCCILFLSNAYVEKPVTRYESQIILSENLFVEKPVTRYESQIILSENLFKENFMYIFKFDDVTLPGLNRNFVYSSAAEFPEPEAYSNFIYEVIRGKKPKDDSGTFLYESLADGLVQILDRCASQYKFTLRSDRQSNKLLLRLRSGAAVLLQVQVGQLLGKSGVCLWMHPGSRSCDDHAYQGCVTWSASKCQYRLENRGLLLDLTPEIEFPSLAGLLERLDREIQTILGVSA